jgi:hypothetical protein
MVPHSLAAFLNFSGDRRLHLSVVLFASRPMSLLIGRRSVEASAKQVVLQFAVILRQAKQQTDSPKTVA